MEGFCANFGAFAFIPVRLLFIPVRLQFIPEKSPD
jgi:hypothetical protein